jgi:hypothetical protein
MKLLAALPTDRAIEHTPVLHVTPPDDHDGATSRARIRMWTGRWTPGSPPCGAQARRSSMSGVPKWLLDAKGQLYDAIRFPEFATQIGDYLKTFGPGYPKNIDRLLARATARSATPDT